MEQTDGSTTVMDVFASRAFFTPPQPSKMRRNIFLQPDYLLLIVARPENWSPEALDDVPEQLDIVNEYHVASHAEAMDDLRRCNRQALDYDLSVWAVVASTACGL